MTSILLLVPRTSWIGAILRISVMKGAIVSHLTILEIDVQGDGGQLFGMALITFLCCAFVLFYERTKVLSFVSTILKKG